ncbi:MAG: hypothetical protein ICV74_04080 [Thermoleophilia bacterium]|nr:hypothetical protein [Thermoleophilia bacterium]
MRHFGTIRRARMLVLAAATVVVLGASATSALARDAHPRVLPPTANPHGQSYGAWAAEWWQWALSQPASVNPVLDETGEHCAQAQEGHVWFLAGAFTSEPVTRTCTVPTGTALFFPVVNYVYCAEATDPPEQQTEEFVREQVAFLREAVSGLSATVDGVQVPDIELRYYEESPFFSVVLPEDNVFGRPAGSVLEPCADAGFYLMLAPLPPGEHMIHIAGSIPEAGFSLDVTYELEVVPRGQLLRASS